MQEALKFWHSTVGFEVLRERQGNDLDLTILLGLEQGTIKSQTVLASNSSQTQGLLHLVEFSDPAPAVRKGASPTDSCPKNIDIYSNNLEHHYASMQTAGFPFRAPWQLLKVEDPSGLAEVKEGQLAGPNHTNIGVMELVGMPLSFNEAGFSGLGPLVTTVDDVAQENAFYTQVLGLDLCTQHALGGPEIEKIIGLPPGKSLHMHILGDKYDWYGRVELIEYQGISGKNLYPRAQAPATGALHLSYETNDIRKILDNAAQLNIEVNNLGKLKTLTSFEPMLAYQLTTPAGFKLFVLLRG